MTKERSLSPEEPLTLRGRSFHGDGAQGQARIFYMKTERILKSLRKTG